MMPLFIHPVSTIILRLYLVIASGLGKFYCITKNLPMQTTKNFTVLTIRAVAGQRSSPDLCFATKLIKIYDP